MTEQVTYFTKHTNIATIYNEYWSKKYLEKLLKSKLGGLGRETWRSIKRGGWVQACEGCNFSINVENVLWEWIYVIDLNHNMIERLGVKWAAS